MPTRKNDQRRTGEVVGSIAVEGDPGVSTGLVSIFLQAVMSGIGDLPLDCGKRDSTAIGDRTPRTGNSRLRFAWMTLSPTAPQLTQRHPQTPEREPSLGSMRYSWIMKPSQRGHPMLAPLNWRRRGLRGLSARSVDSHGWKLLPSSRSCETECCASLHTCSPMSAWPS